MHRAPPGVERGACTIIALYPPATPRLAVTTTVPTPTITMRPYQRQGEIDYARLDFDPHKLVLKPEAQAAVEQAGRLVAEARIRQLQAELRRRQTEQ